MLRDGACPACGEPAECGMAKGQSTCWCCELPPVMPMPPEASGARCYCRTCLEKLAVERVAADPAGPAAGAGQGGGGRLR